MDERHDVVIVGGGIMGATTLYEFARRGVDAILLERDPELGGRDSSKTAGIMRTHYSNPAVVRMAIRGREAFRDIAGIAGVEPVLHAIGYVFLASPDTVERARDNVAMQREQGAEVEELPSSARGSGSRRAPPRTASRRSSTSRTRATSPGAGRPGVRRGRPRHGPWRRGAPVRRLLMAHGA